MKYYRLKSISSRAFTAIFYVIIIWGCKEKAEKLDPFSSCKDYDNSHKRMLVIVEKIKKRFSKDKVFLDLFKDSQNYWTQYRSRRISALYPRDFDRHYRKNYGRETFNPCKCEENNRLVELRIKELMVYLEEKESSCPNVNQELLLREKGED